MKRGYFEPGDLHRFGKLSARKVQPPGKWFLDQNTRNDFNDDCMDIDTNEDHFIESLLTTVNGLAADHEEAVSDKPCMYNPKMVCTPVSYPFVSDTSEHC